MVWYVLSIDGRRGGGTVWYMVDIDGRGMV